MNGKIIGIAIMFSAFVAGVSLYYLQIYAFYDQVINEDVQLISVASNVSEPIQFENFEAIDAESSPIRYRACFTTELPLSILKNRYVTIENATPRNAPWWFDCFNSETIGMDLLNGHALSFLGQKNIEFGVDRIVTINTQGRGFVWHELNDCGKKAYDGTIVGEQCPRKKGVNK
ncbi:MAG: histidine kinase [Tateyamaria sp.]|jgi:hypothetical protein|nr:histidine kinase [Tateyamaria sp.]MBT7800762.1 histidine kinase [Tateyamaria sp.]